MSEGSQTVMDLRKRGGGRERLGGRKGCNFEKRKKRPL